MSIPMQLAIPLALHLRSPVKGNIFTNEHFKPGEKFQESRTIADFAFINQYAERGRATITFASIFRALYNHSDWSQLFSFFSKRYSKSQMLSDRESRKFSIPLDATSLHAGKKHTVHFKTEPSQVGLPADFFNLILQAGKDARGSMLGPDPTPCSVGPAISVGVGAGEYMNLMYAHHPPGKYPEQHRIGEDIYRHDAAGNFRAISGPIHKEAKGGRGRTWDEWAMLWAVIAEWIYEYDSARLQYGSLSHHSYKYRLSDEEHNSFRIGDKIPRKFFSTDAIDSADAVRDVFAQLASNPNHFHGIEWDFIELERRRDLPEAFYARFGTKKTGERGEVAEHLLRPFQDRWDLLDYDDVAPLALKQCPSTFHGSDWEAWFLSIEGGDVVIANNMFQALWAVSLLTQLPLNIKVLPKGSRVPRYRDLDDVYL